MLRAGSRGGRRGFVARGRVGRDARGGAMREERGDRRGRATPWAGLGAET